MRTGGEPSGPLQRLSADGGPLEVLARVVDFEAFRLMLVAALAYSDGAKGGRPPLAGRSPTSRSRGYRRFEALPSAG